jgi:hypothetical protein
MFTFGVARVAVVVQTEQMEAQERPDIMFQQPAYL